jgi:predicted DCC family thiol-disulfide oxidoreductase YuxK
VPSGGACVEHREPIEVFYDGECRLCTASRAWAEGRDSERRLAFKDLNDPAAVGAVPIPPERLREAMWVRLPEGKLASGFYGWLEILHVLPWWRLVAGLLRLPPLQWIGPAVYRLVARHRHLLPRR